jgi:hexosaminidase
VIGWGDILEGGLAPGAIVQSWQDFNAAVQSAKEKHYTIVSPASHTYLDNSPEDLDLRIAYSFNPIPTELTGDDAKYVIGSEVNLWTERAPQELVDSKLFPRTLALAEAFWSNPNTKDYDEFYSRVQETYADLKALGIRYGAESKSYFPKTKYDENKKQFTVEMIRGQKDIDIRYTADGSEVSADSKMYNEPVTVEKTASLKFAAFKDGQNIGKKFTLSFDFHKALNARLKLETPYSERYRAAGDNTLIDGVRGTNDFRDANWQGYDGTDFIGVIDLGKEIPVNKVIQRFILASNSWVFLPLKVSVSLSADGINFTNVQESVNDINQKNSDIVLKDFTCNFNSVSARYVKVHAENMKTIPAWHPGAGSKAWMFTDEIVVE